VEVLITPWVDGGAPTEAALRKHMEDEGLRPYAWSNEAFEQYAAHSHAYDKVIYVVRGSIRFGLPADGRSLLITAGDRLELPAGTVHDAAVGDAGVGCLEAHVG
jgi:uncharacterized protein YjlB